jgi:ubiquinone/menaquinone biosynthesis C-methylase UbiE
MSAPERTETDRVREIQDKQAAARARATELAVAVDLRLGDAQRLGDESFDTVLITFALCTIPDDRAAVAEAIRVLRPGGRLIAIEHVRSPVRPVRAVSACWSHCPSASAPIT